MTQQTEYRVCRLTEPCRKKKKSFPEGAERWDAKMQIRSQRQIRCLSTESPIRTVLWHLTQQWWHMTQINRKKAGRRELTAPGGLPGGKLFLAGSRGATTLLRLENTILVGVEQLVLATANKLACSLLLFKTTQCVPWQRDSVAILWWKEESRTWLPKNGFLVRK